MPADSPSPRLSSARFAQLCATILLAVILVLTGCMAVSLDEAEEATSALWKVAAVDSLLIGEVLKAGTPSVTPNEQSGVGVFGAKSRLALAKRCSWAGNFRERHPRFASYGRTRPRARRTSCRSNLPLSAAHPGTRMA